jgi:hypothetical protein
MNTDIRLDVDFYGHPKTIKLIRRLGFEGVVCLQRLWLFAAKHKCDGDLDGMDEEEIAIASGWNNDPSTFVTTLVQLRWLDVDNETYSLHKWVDRNGYAASSDDRSDKSRFSRMAKLYPAVYNDLKSQGYTAISAEEFKKVTAPVRVFHNELSTTVERPLNESLTNSLSPLPPPLPSPSPNPIPLNTVEDNACERMRLSEAQDLHINCLGKIPHNPLSITVLQDICRDYPPDRIRTAFKAVVSADRPNLNWIKSYLDNPQNWHKNVVKLSPRAGVMKVITSTDPEYYKS